MQIARKIREVRENAGLSQAELARRAGIDRRQVSRWETGRGKPNLDNIQKLEKALGVDDDTRLMVALLTDQTARRPEILEGWLEKLKDRAGRPEEPPDADTVGRLLKELLTEDYEATQDLLELLGAEDAISFLFYAFGELRKRSIYVASGDPSIVHNLSDLVEQIDADSSAREAVGLLVESECLRSADGIRSLKMVLRGYMSESGTLPTQDEHAEEQERLGRQGRAGQAGG